VPDDFGEHLALARFDRGFPARAGDVFGADLVPCHWSTQAGTDVGEGVDGLHGNSSTTVVRLGATSSEARQAGRDRGSAGLSLSVQSARIWVTTIAMAKKP
jgi:hypothetical protein